MTEFEILARSPEQAKQKVAAKHGLSEAELEVTAEFEPDEVDVQTLTAEEEANPELKIEGEPVLYQLRSGVRGYLERAQTVSQNIMDCMAEGATVEAVGFGHGILVRVEAPDPSFLIGKGGASLDAIQHVVSRCCASKDETFPDIILDVGGYRERRLLRLGHEASEAAHRVLEQRRSYSLEPMNPVERKYIHNMLKNIPGIITKSDGYEPDRYIIVSVPDAEDGGEASPPRGRRGRRGRGRGSRDDRGPREDRGPRSDRGPRQDRGARPSNPAPAGAPTDIDAEDEDGPSPFNRAPDQQQQRPHRQHGGRGGGRDRDRRHGGGGGGQHRGNQDRRPNTGGGGSYQPPPPDYTVGTPLSRMQARSGNSGGGGGNRRGGYGGGGGGNRRGGPAPRGDGRPRGNEMFDPTRHIDYSGLPKITPEEEEAAYRDQAIEGRQSRLPVYRPQELPEDDTNPDRRLVDEIE